MKNSGSRTAVGTDPIQPPNHPDRTWLVPCGLPSIDRNAAYVAPPPPKASVAVSVRRPKVAGDWLGANRGPRGMPLSPSMVQLASGFVGSNVALPPRSGGPPRKLTAKTAGAA